MSKLPDPAETALFRRQLEAFVSFTDAEWALFTPGLFIRPLRKKALFLKAGAVCTEIGFILDGSTRCFYTRDGVEISSYFSFSGDMVTSYGSFLQRTPSAVSIEALEDCRLLILSCGALEAMMADDRLAPKIERLGRLIAEYLVCCYEDRMRAFLTQSPEERYAQLLQEAPDFLQRIPQRHIANYLGVTAVSLSRIRRRMMGKHTLGR